MIAEYVQVSPDELAQLVADPSSIGRLLHDASPGSFGPFMSGAARDRLERMTPELLSRATQGLDPRLQEQIAERIGVVREALASEEGGKAIVRLMEERGLLGDSTSSPDPPRRRLSLDKAWHGVHFLLTGEPEPTSNALGSAILGGREIGEDEGYGPARYFGPADVVAIAAALGEEGLEDELRARYEPERMIALGIYPGGWSESGPGWLLDAFRDLQGFFRDAAADGNAVVTCLV